MPSGTTAHLRVVIDARLVPGEAGGVEAVIKGLASGLSALDGPEDYVFAVGRGEEAWLRPHLHGPARAESVDWEPDLSVGKVARALDRGGRFGRRLSRLLSDPVVDYDRLVPSLHPGIECLKPDVVHLPRQRGVRSAAPTIYHPHDLQHVHLPAFFSPQERAWRERVYGELCRLASMVAVASEWTRRDVIHHFNLEPSKVRLVRFAPPMAVERSPSPEQIAEVTKRYSVPARYLLYPAQTWPHKNHARLLEALALLRDRGTPITLVSTGGQTEHLESLRALARALDLEKHVIWAGLLPGADLAAMYAGARAVVIPSLFEAASAPLWEAFLFGVPAACSNVTSLPDEAGDAAVIFDPLRPDHIADAIATVWNDDGLRTRLVDAGRRQISALSWDRTARRFRAHYRRLGGQRLSDEDRTLTAITA